MARVAAVLLHPEVRPFIGDDFTPVDWKPDNASLYLMVPGVVFMFTPINSVLWECHVGAIPGVGGRVGAAKSAMAWMRANTPCRALVAMVPEYNAFALRFAEKIGMERCGRLSRAIQRDGSLCDLMLYEVEI